LEADEHSIAAVQTLRAAFNKVMNVFDLCVKWGETEAIS